MKIKNVLFQYPKIFRYQHILQNGLTRYLCFLLLKNTLIEARLPKGIVMYIEGYLRVSISANLNN